MLHDDDTLSTTSAATAGVSTMHELLADGQGVVGEGTRQRQRCIYCFAYSAGSWSTERCYGGFGSCD
jgi:hypothetical protein